MFVIGTEVVERHFKTHVGHKGIKATRTQYHAWLAIVGRAQWRTPEDVKASYPKASILKGSRVVFNIKGNDYRLIASVQYQAGVLAIRFFGTHAEGAQHGDGAASARSFPCAGRFAPSSFEEAAAPAFHQASGGLSLTAGASPRWNGSSIIRCLAAASVTGIADYH